MRQATAEATFSTDPCEDAESLQDLNTPEDETATPSGRARGHVGHTDDELREMRKYDLKRVKRIMANRSSAARSKVRKLRYTNELDSRIAALSNEQRSMQEEFYAMQAKIATISKENDLLSDEIRRLYEDVSQATIQSRQLKQHAHFLRVQVLAAPAALNFAALPSYAVAPPKDPPGPLQLPQRAPAPAAADPLASFASGTDPSSLKLSGQQSRDSLQFPSMLAQTRQPNPFNSTQLWPHALSTSSASSAISSHTAGRAFAGGGDQQLAPEDPFLLNMLQSIEISADAAALRSDVSSQSAIYNTGSSWNAVQPNLSHVLDTRSSLGSLPPADSPAWRQLVSLSPLVGAADPSSMLPRIEQESRQFQRRSAGDFPAGLQGSTLQGLARFPRHASTPAHQQQSRMLRLSHGGFPQDRQLRGGHEV